MHTPCAGFPTPEPRRGISARKFPVSNSFSQFHFRRNTANFIRSSTSTPIQVSTRFYLDTYILWSYPRNFSVLRVILELVQPPHLHLHPTTTVTALRGAGRSPPLLHRSMRLLRRCKATENQAWRRTIQCAIFSRVSSHRTQLRVVPSSLIPDENQQEERQADQHAQQRCEEQPQRHQEHLVGNMP